MGLDLSNVGNVEQGTQILLIEDDEKLARLTARYLEKNGVGCALAADGITGLQMAEAGRYDAILLDLMLPGIDGLEVCKRIRAAQNTPIIMLTARGEESDRIIGLELGADDYLSKPFSSRELLARLKAQIRRARGAFPSASRTLVVGALRLDLDRRRVSIGDSEVTLTTHEFAMLKAMAEKAGEPISRERLLELTTGSADSAFDRSVDVTISRLRQKLGDDSRNPELVVTVRGVGYLLSRPEFP